MYKNLLSAALVLSVALTGCGIAKESHKPTNISVKESLHRLEQGNKRYTTSGIHPHQSQAHRKSLTNGQHPFAVIITCADSRVPPEIIFDQGLGDLFVIRNAGNVIDENVIASVEYAVAHLATPLVVVMGHQSCGAVTAAVNNAKDSEHIVQLVNRIKPAVNKAKHQSGCLVTNSIHENVHLAVNQLKNSEPIISKAVANNETRVIGAYYHLDTGKVNFLD